MGTGGGSIFRTLCLVVGLSAGLAVSADDAFGQSRVCRNLAAELKVATGKGSNSQARKLQNAIAKQNAQLGKVRAQIRQAQCGFGIFGNNVSQCATLRKSASSMENNVWKLQMQLDGRSRANSGRTRARILASMRANSCNDKPAVKSVSAPTKAKAKPERKSGGTDKSQPRSGGVYRTMCVRTCDGYYFPISFSVSKDMFGRDEKTCQARCPGAEVELYAHDVLNEESEDMVSIAKGTPYRNLPKAFSYRRDGVSKNICGCRSTRNFSVIAGEPPAEDGLAASDAAALASREATASVNDGSGASFYVPTPRPDPNMVATAVDKNAIDETSKAESEAAATPSLASAPRRVRIVGPEFLPDPEEAIDLRAPAQNRVQ